MDLASPKLLEILIISNALQNLNAASLPPFTSNDTKVPPDPICAIANACCGWLSSPGKITFEMRSSDSSTRAISNAASAIARQRKSSVAMPFSMIHAVNGDIDPPVCFIKGSAVLRIKSRDAQITPPSARPCPSMCLVVEYTTTSAPCATAWLNTGVENTLSTITNAPIAWAIFDTSVMSTSSSVGFDIDSKNTALVPGVTAFRHAVRSAPSTNVTRTPKRVSTSSST